jgi:tripartite-type tricarboxylate transporter receptor subunit TctC
VLEKKLGVPVNIEFRPGAGSLVAVAHVLSNKNDDHTFIVCLDDFLTNSIFKEYSYYKEFVPTNIIGTVPFVLSAKGTVDAKTMREQFVTRVKNKESFSVAATGTTSSAAIWLRAIPEIQDKIVIATYKGAPGMITDVRGGHVDYVTMTLASTMDQLKQGGLTAVMVSYPTRFNKIADVPTFKEMGLSNGENYGFFSVVTRADTAKAAQEIFSRTVNEAVREGALVKFEDRMMFMNYNLAQSNNFYKQEIKRYKEFYKKNKHLLVQQ